MSGSTDRRERELERRIVLGDTDAQAELVAGRFRRNRCPWCAEAGAVHSFTRISDDEDHEEVCCCNDCFKLHGLQGGGVCPGCPGAQAFTRRVSDDED
jgi:hypothetical protein